MCHDLLVIYMDFKLWEGRLITVILAGHVHGYEAQRNAALSGYFEEAVRKVPHRWQDFRLSTVVSHAEIYSSVSGFTLFFALMNKIIFLMMMVLADDLSVIVSLVPCHMCCWQYHPDHERLEIKTGDLGLLRSLRMSCILAYRFGSCHYNISMVSLGPNS